MSIQINENGLRVSLREELRKSEKPSDKALVKAIYQKAPTTPRPNENQPKNK